ncbi:NADPH:adrenodoxin oxidoreductase, mitochondrial [Drosophila sulfurigaster albostrigata]|uniref:NADPH:adrenodoxin oxidoreductase, mitochondrial n=1 Tax=Drosophila sulfurigaster albostrigata TaxID=89887 RepID=UPI002D21D6E9|nr:NADPH:adrenodoxin oxidoreductase, mitochondrial [Drosophila sulfurigaster albostrigata]
MNYTRNLRYCRRQFFNVYNNSFSTSAIKSQSVQQVAQPKRICIVGAGPAGFYAAQYLLKQLSDCSVDIVEKLPVPFGLVRFGVAPDHPEVKNVINTFTKTAENPRLRFFGNVTLGTDVTLQELRERYHAVLLTYGADQDRELELHNEQQAHVISARKFVAWYNGLPGAEQLQPDLSGRDVTIVGQGNVAVDVARMLLSPIDNLKVTDTTEYALEALANSKVERVHLVGRRGPLQAAFTIKELREMLKLPQVETRWRPEDFTGVDAQLDKLQRPRKRLTELMLKSLGEQSNRQSGDISKQFLPIFLRAPKAIVEREMEFAITEVQENSAVATSATEKLPADLILRSIGYKSSCADAGINFDARRGQVCNEQGRVLQDKETKQTAPGLYVAGWLGTGPTGVILTTMNGAFAVAKTICDDIAANAFDTTSLKPGFDPSNKPIVTWEGWQRIDKHETEAGKAKGKPREKIVSIPEMLRIAGV